jgi:hypothetical protein
VTQAREVAEKPNSLFRGWGSACAIFFAVVTVALLATLGIAWAWGGQRFLASAAVAWGLVWFSALVALFIVFIGRQMGQGLGAVLIGMGLRMGLPMVIALTLVDQSPGWAETKLMPFLLGNYFIALIAETSLAIQVLNTGTVPPLGVRSSVKSGELVS